MQPLVEEEDSLPPLKFPAGAGGGGITTGTIFELVDEDEEDIM